MPGIFTTDDLLACGRSPRQIQAMLQRGVLVRLSRGVFATADLHARLQTVREGEPLLRAAAALATAGPGAVASHQTAAQVHGLDLLRQPAPVVTLTRPPGTGSRSAKHGVHVHAANLPASHAGGRFGVPVTTVARTVVDLARELDFTDGVVVADSALHQHLTSKNELRAMLTACARWPGVSRAAQVVEFADGLAESVLESIARVAFRNLGLPPPELQVEIRDADGQLIGRVDFLWRRFRTIAEVDGALKYDDRTRAQAQLRRDKKLRAAGYEVEHFDWREIMHAEAEVGGPLRAAFRRGGQQRASGPAA